MVLSGADRAIELLSDPEVIKNLGEAVALWKKRRNKGKEAQ